MGPAFHFFRYYTALEAKKQQFLIAISCDVWYNPSIRKRGAQIMAKKKWGDRKDGIWLKDIPAMNRIMPPLMPNRADNEAHISVDIDIRPINADL